MAYWYSTGIWLPCPYAVPVVGLSILLLSGSLLAGIVWGSFRIHLVTTAIATDRYSLVWDTYSNFEQRDDDLGKIYSNYVNFFAVGNYKFEVAFRVESGRQLGLLFVDVVITEPDNYISKRHYCLGQFQTNNGAKLFAQFALNHFIETETWAVCPSFRPVDYIDGIPYTLSGEEIVSELI